MSERRAIQPIAPGQRGVKALEEPKPMKMQVAEAKPRVERLSMSKQWVLPPRPKPGRKPKAASEKASGKVAKPAPVSRRSGESSAARGAGVTKGRSRDEASQSPNGTASFAVGSPVDRGGESHHNGSLASKIPGSTNGVQRHASHGAHGDVEDDSCGLCTREECVCDDIGLKASPAAATAAPSPHTETRRPTLPSLDMILDQSTIKMDAVPIRRPAKSRAAGAPMSKFKKAFTFEPLHPSPDMAVASPLEGMPINSEAGCGFCSENTVCVCASDTNGGQVMPLPPPSQSSSSSAGITMSPGPRGSVQLPPISPGPLETEPVPMEEDVYGCSECERGPMSMLFCVSLSASRQLAPGAVAIPCNLAFKTLQKHHRFDGCDLGKLVRRLECSKKMVGVQSINRVLQDLERNEFAPQF